MDTKFFPTKGKGMPGEELSHEPEDLRKHLLKSLDALKTKAVGMWYLHGPDRTTPYEVTLKAVNDLYKEGYFDRFAISNYMAWEVAEICELCDRNGWVKPVAYQGVYNALHRSVE
jgi:aflatoxin B1 aldehyde reductase